MPEIQNKKKRLREEALARRAALTPSARLAADQAMAEAAHHIDIAAGEIVAGFWPIRAEPDVRRILESFREKGARICLPAVVGPGIVVFREYLPGADPVPAGFGTFAPGPDAPEIDPDLILMPLAAFDSDGNRIGYGAGFYDRAIARLHDRGKSPRRIGIAFACQEVPAIPAEAHDVALHAILTQSGLHWFERRC